MVKGPGIFTTFAYYFGLTAILGCVAASKAMGVSYRYPAAVQAGLLLGIFAGGAGVLFNRSVALELQLPAKRRDRAALLKTVDDALEQLFFEELAVQQEDAVKVYQRPTGAWLSGNVYVQCDDTLVRIVGRARVMRLLKAKLQ